MRIFVIWMLVLVGMLMRQALCPSPVHAAVPVGEIRSMSGEVATLPLGATVWMPAEVGRQIQPGDAVRTGPASRAAILCVDESQIKLGENTMMVFKSAAPSSRLGYQPVAATDGSLYEVRQGRAWLRNSNEDFRFELDTPAVTAAIRGTEFTVDVDSEGASVIALLQGRLAIFNDYGSLDLFSGEMAQARPGQAPRKQVMLQPLDAVQWVLYYPGTGNIRELKLAALGDTDSDSRAWQAYDRGDFPGARELALSELSTGEQSRALTVLGFLELRAGRDQTALEHFEKALRSAQSPQAVAGRCLALYRLGAQDQAFTFFMKATKDRPRTPDMLAVGGFLALMAGKPELARELLQKGLSLAPDHAGCHAQLAQIALVGNRKDEARIHAEAALRAAPDSPQALLGVGLVDIAFFDLLRAEQRMILATKRDPEMVEPLLYLARLRLGAEHLDEAQDTLNRAAAIAPRDASVLSMNGFVHLALRDHESARQSFEQSARLDPSLADPHLGLGLCAYARGDEASGLRELLAATLLDPRVSQFQSMLGKAFFQSRAFDKALETFDYASTLDPNDPTPHLYKGIALTDLNRPGEAIQEINTSIAKNDNRAVFRSSLMLDRDLAVRNTDLAKSYSTLGLGEWSYSKALTAVKNDPQNPSAHLFLSSVFAYSRQRTSAAGSELTLFRLLSPANQNTFSGLDYTPMFESPYARVFTTGSVGAWSNGNAVNSAGIEGYGGAPGFALDTFASIVRDEGMRDHNSMTQPIMASGLVKWEPTVKDAFFGSLTVHDTTAEDTNSLNDWSYHNSRVMEQDFRTRFGELSYVRRFTPESTLLLYGKQSFHSWKYTDQTHDPDYWEYAGWPIGELVDTERETSMTFTNVQAQQQFTSGPHTIMAGVDFFRGSFHYDYDERDSYWWWYEGEPFFIYEYFNPNRYSGDQDSLNVYVLDYWKPIEDLVVEFGLSAERTSAVRYGYSDPVDRNLVGSRFGLNWQVTDRDVLRFALQNYLNTHLMYQSTLQPADVAGFPSWLNADDGSEVLEAGVAWERQWNDLTYSVVRLNAHDVKNPEYDPASDNEVRDIKVRRFLAQATLNRILTPSLGLWTTVSAKRLLPNDFALSFSPNTDFSEADLALGLSYLHENGFGATASSILVHQHFVDADARDLGGDKLDDEMFALFNAGCSYTLPNRKGRINLDVKNIFDQRFSYQQEMVTLDSIFPARQAVLSVSFSF